MEIVNELKSMNYLSLFQPSDCLISFQAEKIGSEFFVYIEIESMEILTIKQKQFFRHLFQKRQQKKMWD